MGPMASWAERSGHESPGVTCPPRAQKGREGTEPQRPPGPPRPACTQAPPGGAGRGNAVWRHRPPRRPPWPRRAGRQAYLVLHSVQTGADGVAAAVLALLCGAKRGNQGCVPAAGGGHLDWARGQGGWGSRGPNPRAPGSASVARTWGGGGWGWGLGGETPALMHSSRPCDWGAGDRRTGVRPMACDPCRPGPHGSCGNLGVNWGDPQGPAWPRPPHCDPQPRPRP